VKSEDRPQAGIGVETVGEAGFDAGGLVGKGERVVPGGKSDRQPFGVALGLDLDAGQGDADLLRLDHFGGPIKAGSGGFQ